jgi:microcystin degradation protein MlrC
MHATAAITIATKVIEVEAPGISSPNARRFTYHNLRRPIYPLDADMADPDLVPELIGRSG